MEQPDATAGSPPDPSPGTPAARAVEFTRTVPVLRIFDEAAARAFYVDYLGMTVDWEHRFEPGMPLYMQVSRAGLTLHLTGHHADACPGATLFITVTGLAALHAGLKQKNYLNVRPGIEKTFHNSMQVALTDPFGNRLRLDEPLGDPTPPAET